MNTNVVVIIGVGGIGRAIARRQGAGRTLLLADFNEQALESVKLELEEVGYTVLTMQVDVSSRVSVKTLAARAADWGNVVQVVTTAGLSPNMANAQSILEVDLLGVALVLEEFEHVIAEEGAAVVISSMAGYMQPVLPQEQAQALARTPADELLALPFLQPDAITGSGPAYAISKRANHLRVEYASIAWGARGARVNSISPGIIATPMAQHEMASSVGAVYRHMIDTSSSARMGTPDEVAAAAAYLLGPESRFMTGSDLLIDGGVIAAIRAGKISLSA